MKFPEYKQIVNLIPGGCPQFLDFRLDADSMKREMRSFREETAAYDDAGKLKNIYLAGEYGGFAIHILRG